MKTFDPLETKEAPGLDSGSPTITENNFDQTTTSPGAMQEVESNAGGNIEIYYEAPAQKWWTKNKRGTFITVNETDVKRYLKGAGYLSLKDGAGLSGVEREMMRIQQEMDVVYAGGVAGFPVGVHESNGSRILVTTQGHPTQARPGSCKHLVDLLREMLGEHQLIVLLGWLKIRRQCVLQNRWRPGQAVALVGPAGCGKSFSQHLITMLLGGRVAKPWRYLTGDTTFNAELLASEHLSVEDDAARADIHTRRLIGAAIKTTLFAKSQSGHAKNRTAVTLEPRLALTFSINDEPENLQVLPPLDPSLLDKLSILKCDAVPRPVPPGMDEKEWLEDLVEAELPGLAHLIDGFEIPPEFQDRRCGVIAYQHPGIVQELIALAPESRLLSVIDQVLFSGPSSGPWEGSAVDLERRLRSSELGDEVRRIATWSNAVATYLGRLAHQCPNRVRHVRTAARNLWGIEPPTEV